MIVYWDTSALVKAYVQEAGSSEVLALLGDGTALIGSALITQVEMAAALEKAARFNKLAQRLIAASWQDFLGDWAAFTRIQVSEALIARASQVAFDFKLRGYDALHLAAAMAWQEALAEPVTLATFDRELWLAARQARLDAWPQGLAG